MRSRCHLFVTPSPFEGSPLRYSAEISNRLVTGKGPAGEPAILLHSSHVQFGGPTAAAAREMNGGYERRIDKTDQVRSRGFLPRALETGSG
jgi:hypothetical protein